METKKRQEMYEHLNSLAFDLKFKQLAPFQMQKHSAELFSSLLKLVNKPEIKKARANLNKADETLTESECIGLSIVADAYTEAFDNYGTEKWVENDVPVPFVKMFFGFLRHKLMFNYSTATQQFFEKNDEKLRLKKISLNRMLEKMASERMISEYSAPKNINNYEKLSIELQKIGYDEIESIRKAFEMIETINILSIDNTDEEDNENGSNPVATELERVTEEKLRMQDAAAYEAVATVVKTFNMAMEDEAFSETDKDFIRYYLTKLIFENDLLEEKILQELIDPEFADFLKSKEKFNIKPTCEVLSEFFDLQPDTVRKKMKYAQRILISKRALIK